MIHLDTKCFVVLLLHIIFEEGTTSEPLTKSGIVGYMRLFSLDCMHT